ncbi:hypothetical protein AJ80_08964 [Polytolypa hystricis UAMH7299]|uniref:Uncharacterized protein n=1 Tax=Polytolypa hystricis (strain UAMH7299) TaxID=1447883 RepID=A0A2B7WZ00_POLH7|nr:hypothetical protein AJ80_08964 [Polytolypa hystricis UAMH7299]
MALPTRYMIVQRSLGSASVPPQDANTEEYTYVASALDIAFALLSTEKVKATMVYVARFFDQTVTEVPRIFADASDAVVSARINSFIEALRGQMPLIVIDGRLTDQRIPAYHPRGIWSGNFNPSDQMIVLNKSLVDSMVGAVNTSGLFRRFQFQFANIFLHEIGGHLLFTYLYDGRPMTPPQMMPLSWSGQAQPGSSEPAGESGRFLEDVLLQGTLEFFDTPQVSSAWIVDADGNAKRVTMQAIDTAVINRSFTLPYPTANPLTNVSSLIASQGRLEVARTAGQTERHFIARAKEQPIRFYISRSDLRLVPNNPSVLAQKVQA